MLFFTFLFLYACKVSHINHSIKRIFPKRRWEIPYSCFFLPLNNGFSEYYVYICLTLITKYNYPMKVLQSSLLRAVCAIVVGALLVKYREQTVTWMTIAIGVLFFISGVFSCASYLIARSRKDDVQVFDAQGRQLRGMRPAFPIVGLGSLILGLILAIMPGTFVSSLMYILAAILILGAVTQFMNLIAASRLARVGIYFWIMPTLTLLVGLIAVISPSSIASAPLFVIGWAMMVYGVVEVINAVKIHLLHRTIERALQNQIQQQHNNETNTNESKD